MRRAYPRIFLGKYHVSSSDFSLSRAGFKSAGEKVETFDPRSSSVFIAIDKLDSAKVARSTSLKKHLDNNGIIAKSFFKFFS